MRAKPVPLGALLGLLIPAVILAPSAIAGGLRTVLSAGVPFLLLPALSLLLVPGGLAGFLAARRFAERRDAWRFAVGLFLGGSLFGALLLYAGGADRPFDNRLVHALFGGPLLVGFWLFLGALLGLAAGAGRREGSHGSPNP